MSTFDEFINGAKKIFDVASEKTNEVYESSKIYIERSQLNCNLRDEYEKLGKICFNMSETGIDLSSEMTGHITNIKKLLNEIKVKNEELKNKSKVNTCSVCGATFSEKYTYCPRCGAKL